MQMIDGKAFQLICRKWRSNAASCIRIARSLRTEQHTSRLETSGRIDADSGKNHKQQATENTKFFLCSLRVHVGRILPDATPQCAYVSHAVNLTIGSNFCQAPFVKKLEPEQAESTARQRRNQRNGTTDKEDFSTQSRQGAKTPSRKDHFAPLRPCVFALRTALAKSSRK